VYVYPCVCVFSCVLQEDFVLHIPASIEDEHDPAEVPDPTGALGPVRLADDRAFYGVSTHACACASAYACVCMYVCLIVCKP